MLRIGALICGLVGLLASFTPASAQLSPPPGGIKRTVLQKIDVPGTNYEVLFVLAEIPAKGATGRHTHPGPETGTLLEGETVLKIDGQPDRSVKPGESWQVAAGVVHDAIVGDKAAKIIVSYTVEKGKPPTTPAPAK